MLLMGVNVILFHILWLRDAAGPQRLRRLRAQTDACTFTRTQQEALEQLSPNHGSQMRRNSRQGLVMCGEKKTASASVAAIRCGGAALGIRASANHHCFDQLYLALLMPVAS